MLTPRKGVSRANAIGFVAAADIGGTRLRLQIADAQGVELSAWSALLDPAGKTPAAVCRLVRDGLHLCCQDAGIDPGQLLHLTAGAPGITDTRTGTVLAAPNLTDWNDVPLQALLEGETGLPVAVENDTNLAALGEYHAGAARGVENFVFFAVGTGLGSGLVLGGRLHAGGRWSAGEVGYLSVHGEPREVPRVHKTGRLEDLVGGGGIERRWRQALAKQGNADPALQALRASGILDRAATGDHTAETILQETARLLADAITDVSLVLDPDLVVLGGGVGAHRTLCPAVEAYLGGNEFARPAVRSSLLGASAQLAGAVAVSLAAVQSRTASS